MSDIMDKINGIMSIIVMFLVTLFMLFLLTYFNDIVLRLIILSIYLVLLFYSMEFIFDFFGNEKLKFLFHKIAIIYSVMLFVGFLIAMIVLNILG